MALKWFIFIISFITILNIKESYEYSSGSPQTQCYSPVPLHLKERNNYYSGYNTQGNATDNPIQSIAISTDPYTATTGDVTVTINLKQTIKGILLRAVTRSGNTMVPVGSWPRCILPANAYKTYSDGSLTNFCLTHTGIQTFSNQIQCTYTTPTGNQGNLLIQATVVTSYDKYWMFSQQLTSNPQLTLSDYITGLTAAPDFSGCGSSKSCFVYPQRCNPTANCEMVASFKAQSNGQTKIEVARYGSQYGYVALGISNTQMMGGNKMILFISNQNPGDLTVMSGNGIQYGVELANDAYITQRKISYITRRGVMGFAGEVMISNSFTFSYSDAGTTKTASMNLESDTYYLFLAKGMTVAGTTQIQPHTEIPVKSSDKVKVAASSDYMTVYGYSMKLNYRVHATLAIVGFVLLAPLSTLLALHYRANLSRRVGGRISIWVIFHVLIIILTFLCGLAALILVLVTNQGWKEKAMTHGILGCVMLGLALINIILGPITIFVSQWPKLHAIISFIHVCIGADVRILSWITVIFALLMNGLQSTFVHYMFMGVTAWIGFEIFFYIIFLTKQSVTYHDYQMEYANKKQYGLIYEKADSRHVQHIGIIAFLIYLLVFVAIAGAFLVFIWMFS